MKKFLTFVLVLAMVLSVSSVALAATEVSDFDAFKAAVEAGGEVKLMADINGDGIVIDKSLTIDLGGYTYTIDGYTVGSTHTKTLGIQILKSATNVVIKNGTIVGSDDADVPACTCSDTSNAKHNATDKVDYGVRMLINNYTNLHLIGVELIGNEKAKYVLSNNSGNVTIEDTTITAADGTVAFDVCKFLNYDEPRVTVRGNSVIEGEVELSGGKAGAEPELKIEGGDFSKATFDKGADTKLAISGGDFSEKPDPAWVVDDKVAVGDDDGEGYVIAEKSDKGVAIDVSPVSLNFTSETVGYAAPAAKKIIVTNIGTGDVYVSQPTDNDYTVTIASGDLELKPSEAVEFYVVPKTGLSAGQHNATFSINASNFADFDMTNNSATIVMEQVAVSFTVNSAPSSGGYYGPNVWYIGGNTFGTNTNQVPTSVEIDGVPVSFTMNGSQITVGCIQPGSGWVTVRWGSVSNYRSFTPDANAYCTQTVIPKTGGMSIWATIAQFLGF